MAEKINEAEFRQLVRKIIKENVEDLGDALEQDLNHNDDVCTSDHENKLLGAPDNKNEPSQDAKSLSESEDFTNAGDAIEVKMNSHDSSKGESSAKVSVKASSGTKKGESIQGMSNASFDTKKGMNNSDNENGGSDKGEDAIDSKMNQMDKEADEGTKAYVEAGSEMKNAGVSTGQADAKFSEEAKNEKSEEPIATAIQLPEGFSEKKWTKSDLMSLINEEAYRVSKLIK